MSLTTASPSGIHSFSTSALTASSQIVAPTSNSRSNENPSLTRAITTIGPRPVASEGGVDGSSATSAMEVSTSISPPASALGSNTGVTASTHAANTPIPNSSRSTNTTPSTTPAPREESTTLSSPSLVTEMFTSSAPASTTSLPLPTTTSDPNLGAHETHELVIDVGNCAEIGTPAVVDFQGNQLKLTSLGDGKFTLGMSYQYDGMAGYSASVFLADDGGRCGPKGLCTRVSIEYSDGAGINMRFARNGDQGLTMYPLSIWMDDAVTRDAQPAGTPETASRCWGWTEEDCPDSSMSENSPEWTIRSESSTARAFIAICPPDGPALSTVGPNPNPPTYTPGSLETWILLPTTTTVPISTFLSAHGLGVGATEPVYLQPTGSVELPPGCSYIFTCISGNSFILEDQASTIISQFSTYIKLDTITTVIRSTFIVEPTSPALTSWVVESTDLVRSTVQSGWAFATLSPGSTRSGMAKPVLATITDSAGSAIVTTIQPSSMPLTHGALVNGVPGDAATTLSPSYNYIVTSWTTWMDVNGSTVPAIAGQAAIETTVPVTYALESGTIIPVGALSSLSIESMRTASPSSTFAAARGGPSISKPGAIVAAIMGTLVGLALGSMLVWFVCCRRRKARSGDYLAQGSLSWGGSREGGPLDLDGGSREREVDREMVVEPWTLPVSVVTRKELESLGAPQSAGGTSDVSGYSNSGPSRKSGPAWAESGPTSSQSQSQPQSEYLPVAGAQGGKSVAARPSGAQSQLQARSLTGSRRPEPLGPEQVHHRDVMLSRPSQPSLPASSEIALSTASLPRRTDDVEQYNAIPPMYNEEWRTT